MTHDIGDFTLERRLRVLKALSEINAEYIVIGGVACNFHGLVRTTKDLDLLIPKNCENTEKILECLGEQLLWGLAREFDAEKVTAKPFTIIGDQPRVDLLTVAGKVTYEDAVDTRVTRRIKGIKVPYVDVDTLIQTKQTGRPSDADDIVKLEAIKQLEKKRNKE